MIATSIYIINAKAEEGGNNVIPIELVDEEQLVKMFEHLD